RDSLGVSPGGKQGCLVDQVCQIRAREAGRHGRDLLGFSVVGELRYLLQVHREDLLPPSLVGPVNQDLPVKPPRSQQSRIEDFGPIGCAEQDQAARRIKAVELGQKLVQCLVLLVMAASDISAAGAAQRIELVYEDDCRSVLARLFEQVAYPGGANADKHLDELRA